MAHVGDFLPEAHITATRTVLAVIIWCAAGIAALAGSDRDALFLALKSAGSEQEANQIKNRIWENWLAAAPSADIGMQVDKATERHRIGQSFPASPCPPTVSAI